MQRYLSNIHKTINLKFCYGQNKIIDRLLCDCNKNCKMFYNSKTSSKPIHCYMINSSKKTFLCMCENKCDAQKSELELYFKK